MIEGTSARARSARRRPRRFAAATLALGVALAGCAAQPELPLRPSSAEVEGTVRRVGVEGGCWVIDTPVGRFEPVGLPPRYRIDGLAVHATLEPAPDLASVCQVAPLARVQSIRGREPGQR